MAVSYYRPTHRAVNLNPVAVNHQDPVSQAECTHKYGQLGRRGKPKSCPVHNAAKYAASYASHRSTLKAS